MCVRVRECVCLQVGGYWDKSCSTVSQLKEGLNRILCLIPYNVISQPLWECFMPEWLEAIRTEVPDNQLKEFREVLRYSGDCYYRLFGLFIIEHSILYHFCSYS